MSTEDFNKRLFILAQVVIALVVVVGGGIALIFELGNAQVIAPFMTLVLGFLYGVQVPSPNQTQSKEASTVNRINAIALLFGASTLMYGLSHYIS